MLGRRPPRRRHGVGGSDADPHHDARRLPECDQRRHGHGLFDQRGHPHPRHGPPRRPRHRPRGLRCGEPQGAGHRQHPSLRREISHGGLLLRRWPAGPDVAADGAPRSRPDHGERQDVGRSAPRRHRLQRRRDPSARQPDLQGRRARAPQGQHRARRLRHQAERVRSALPQAQGQGAGLRQLRGPEEEHQPRGPGRDAGHRARAAQRWPPGRARHARVGHAADPDQARAPGRARHGAPVGRAHVRHELRRVHPARGARSLRRRAARPREDGRRHRARRAEPHHRARNLGRRDGEAPRGARAAGAPLRARLRLDVLPPHQAGQRGLRLRLPGNDLRQARARARDPLSDAVVKHLCRHRARPEGPAIGGHSARGRTHGAKLRAGCSEQVRA